MWILTPGPTWEDIHVSLDKDFTGKLREGKKGHVIDLAQALTHMQVVFQVFFFHVVNK